MGVFTFVLRKPGAGWMTKQHSGDIQESSPSTFEIQRKLVNAVLAADSSGPVRSSFSPVSSSSVIFNVLSSVGRIHINAIDLWCSCVWHLNVNVNDRIVLVVMAVLKVALLLLTDATVNIVVAVGIGATVVNPSDPQNSLVTDPACAPSAAIAENLVAFHANLLQLLPFSSLVALTLNQFRATNLGINLKPNSEPMSVMTKHGVPQSRTNPGPVSDQSRAIQSRSSPLIFAC